MRPAGGLTRRRLVAWVAVFGLAGILCSGFIAWRSDAAFMASGDSDMGSFWTSGWATRHGLDPYQRYAIAPPDWTPWVSNGDRATWRNFNPPAVLPVFELLSRLDPVSVARTSVLLSAIAYFGWLAALALGRDPPPLPRLAWAVLFAGYWQTIVLDQIYVVGLFLPACAAELLLRRGRPVAAGICIGLVCALKPQLLPWPVLVFLAGHRRAAMAAIGAFAVAWLLPILLYGPGVYALWLAGVARDAVPAYAVHPGTASLATVAGVLGGRSGMLACQAALLSGAALWACRSKPSAELASRAGILVAVLAAPLAWASYLLALVPFLLRQARRGWRTRAAAALLAVPVILPMQALGGPLWLNASLGAPYVWATVLLLVGLAAPRGAAGRVWTAVGLRLPCRRSERPPATS